MKKKNLILIILFLAALLPIFFLSFGKAANPYPDAHLNSGKSSFVSTDSPSFMLYLGKEKKIQKIGMSSVYADEKIKAQVLFNGKPEQTVPEVRKISQDIYSVTVLPSNTSHAGLHTLRVILPSIFGGQKIDQNFNWGVLAINPDKSIYKTAENASLAISVLDEGGNMVCDANVNLTITSPDGNVEELSTENKKIKVNSQCFEKIFSLTPDYGANYVTSESGKYQMKLTAKTKNGEYSINDSFEVKNFVPFDVQRIGPTRIYPPLAYPVKMSIVANIDFEGNVFETVPQNFEITQIKDLGVLPYESIKVDKLRNTKTIRWNLNVKKGNKFTLGYQFKAPMISPQFYLLGPLGFQAGGKTIFSEVRQWQIAADPATGDFQTHQTGDWNNVNTWERWNGSSWITPAPNSPTSADGVITVLNGHIVTVTANVTVDQVTVNGGGEVDVNGGGVVWTIANGTGTDLVVAGTSAITGTLSTSASSATTVSGTVSVPGTLTMQGASNTLAVNSGGLVTVSGTANIGNNNLATLTIDNGGNFNVTGSGITTVFSTSANATTINGTLTTSNTSSFIGKRGNAGTPILVNGTLTLNDTSTVSIDTATTAILSVPSGGTIIVASGAKVNGAGQFTLASGGNIQIGSTAGVTSSGASGNIQSTGTRSFSTGANYTYNGTSGQNTGNGFPATVNNLTISNTGAAVTLDASVAITTTLTINSGSILAPVVAAIISGAGGTLTGSGTAQVTRTAATADFSTQYSINTKTLDNLTVEYTNSGESINNLTYGVSGGGGLKVSAAITASTTAAVGGVLTTTAAFVPSAGTITMNNGSSIVTSGSAPTFSAMTIASSATVTTASSFSVASTFTTNSSSSFTASAGTITFTGGSISHSGSTLSFKNLTINGTTSATGSFTVSGNFSIGGSGAFTSTSGTLSVGGDFTNSGTFTHNSGTVTFNGSGTQTIAGSGSPAVTFNNLTLSGGGTVKFTAGETFVVGSSGTFVVSNSTNIDSTSGSQWLMQHLGSTETVNAGTISNSGCSGSNDITVTTGSNGGNNGACWLFGGATYTISGTFYQSNGSSPIGNPPCDNSTTILTIRINGGTATNTSCASSNSTYSFTSIAATTGDIATIYSTDSSNKANLVMVLGSSTTVTGVDLWKNVVIARDENGSGITNANICTYATSLLFSCSSNDITVTSADFLVWTTDTYNSSGKTLTISTSGDFHVDDSATATLDTATNDIIGDVTIDTSSTLNINGSTIVRGGDITATGTLNTTSGTPTLTMRGTGSISGAGSKTFYNLTIGDGTTATTTLSGSASVNNNAVVGTGSTFNINSNLTVTGSLTNTTTGIINTTSGTPTVTVSGSSIGGGSGAITIYNLTKSGAGTTTFSGSSTNTISNNLSVSNGTFTQSNTLSISGSGSVSAGATYNINADLNVTGSLTNATSGVINTTSGTPTVTISGSSIGGGTTGNITFYNLTKSGAGTTTYSNGGTNSVNNNLSVGNGTFTQSDTITVTNDASVSTGVTYNINANLSVNGGDLTTAGTGSIANTSGTPTVTISGTGNLGGGSGSVTFYNLSTSGTGTTTTASDFTVTNVLTIGSSTTLSGGSKTITLSSGGTPLVATGSFTPSSSTIIYSANAATNIAAITYNNLTFSPTVASSSKTYTGLGAITVNNNLSINPTAGSALDLKLLLGGTTVVSGDTNLTRTGSATSTLDTSGTNYSFSTATMTVGANSTLTANNSTISITGTGTPLTISGVFTPGNSTINYTGVGSSVTTAGSTYYNLGTGTTAGSTTTYTLGGNTTVSNVLTLGASSGSTHTLDASSRTITLSGTTGTPFVVNSSGAFTASTSTVSYTGNNGGGNTNITNVSYKNLILNNGSETYISSSSTLNIGGNLTITAGTMDANTNNTPIVLSGNLSISGTLLAPPSASFQVAGDFTNNGTFTHDSGTVTLNGAGTQTLAGSGSPAITFYSLTAATPGQTLQFTAGETFRTNGVLTITGTNGNNVNINSTTGSQWFINHQGTESVTYATVTNSGCDGSSTNISTSNSTNGGNNGACWLSLLSSYAISGTFLGSNESTAIGNPPCDGSTSVLSFRINGGTAVTASCAVSDSTYSKAVNAVSGDVLTIYSTATDKANTVLVVGSSTTISTVNLYKNAVIARDELGSGITNANLGIFDNDDDPTDMLFTSNSNNFSGESGIELHVWTGNTYSPGGTVTTSGTGSLHLDDSSIATLGTTGNTIANNITVDTSATLNINANTDLGGNIVGTGTIASSGTPTLTETGTGSISGAGSKTFYNLVSATGATLNINADTTISHSLTNTTTGIINTISGTPIVTMTGTGNLGGGSGAITIYDLSSSGTGTITSASDFTISHVLTIGSSTTLDGGSNTITLSGAGTPFVISGSFTQNTSTVNYTGATSTNITPATYYNLGGGPTNDSNTVTFTLAGNTGVSHVLTVGASSGNTHSLDASSRTLTLSGTTGTPFVVNSSGAFTASTSTVSYTGNNGGGNTTIKNVTYKNLTLNNGSETFVPASSLTVGGNLTITAGTLDANASNNAISVTGNLTITDTLLAPPSASFTVGGDFTNNGTFTNESGTVTFNSSGTQILAGSGSPAIIFNNLTLSGGGTVKFTVAETFRTDGLFTVSNSTNINSTTSSQWFINHQGTELVNAGTITNSGCDGASTTVTVTTGINGGNNGVCWDIPVVTNNNQTRMKGNIRIKGGVRIKN